MAARVETKVTVASAATFVSGLALWALGKYVFKGGTVPDVLQSWIYAAAPAAITFLAAYRAPHTHRPDLRPPEVPTLPPGYAPPSAALAPPKEETLIPTVPKIPTSSPIVPPGT